MKADLIIVLGAQVLKNGEPSQTLTRRVLSGVALYKQGISPRILMSGCASRGTNVPEATVMAKLAIKVGVPENTILVEPEARNTFENLANSQTIMLENDWQNALVVSDDWHLPRAKFCAEKLNLSANFHGAVAQGYEQGKVKKALSKAREAIAMIKYRLAY
ncbi:MAG: YdcF family protein [Rhodospirillales bacterium]|nr:YdcF family protein [Rhodospirillales bacterium]